VVVPQVAGLLVRIVGGGRSPVLSLADKYLRVSVMDCACECLGLVYWLVSAHKGSVGVGVVGDRGCAGGGCGCPCSSEVGVYIFALLS